MATGAVSGCVMRPLRTLQSGLRLLTAEGPRRMYREGLIFLRKTALRGLHTITGRRTRGTPVFEPDWDLLILLDACRFDAMCEVADEYPFIESVTSFTSLGSHSREWMRRNFVDRSPEEMSQTAYITGNPFSEQLLSADDWFALEEVWKSRWDEQEGTIHPQPITDRVIELARERNPPKIIVHYMQPHPPFIGFAPSNRQDPTTWDDLHLDKTAWDQVRDGDLDRDVAWNAYVDNLRCVLDSIGLLLDNVHAETVAISADHGECVGEYGVYGHPDRIALDPLREVPWVWTTAKDAETYTPETTRKDDEVSRDEKLSALGYQ